MFRRLVLLNLRTSIRWWWLLAVIGTFLLISFYNISRLDSYSEMAQLEPAVWDCLFLSFCGAPFDSSMLDGLVWLLPQILLFYMIGDTIKRELDARGEYILPLIGSHFTWWTGKVIVQIIFVFAFFALGFLVVATSSAIFLPYSSGWSSLIVSDSLFPYLANYKVFQVIVSMFLLLVLAGLATALLQAVLAISFDSTIAYILISAISILAWVSSDYSKTLVYLLPGNQSILSRHAMLPIGMHGFSLYWSFFYDLLVMVSAFIFGYWRLKTKDIVGSEI